MSHQNRNARGVQLNSAGLFKALQWLTRDADWSAIRMRKEATWTPQSLIWTAIRWGVEVFFRHLKQTLGRRKLGSHAAQNAAVELQWSLVGW